MALDALSRIFRVDARTITLRGGEPLALAGQPIQALCFLTAGRIAELAPIEDGGSRLLAVHRPGALLGGVEMLGDGVHRTDLTALRDSELRIVPVGKARRILRRHPDVLAEVARSALKRLGAPAPGDRRKSSILGFVAVCDSVAMRHLAERLAERMRRLGSRMVVLGAADIDCPPSRLSTLESENDFILLAAERRDTAFIAWCGRQIDRLILVGGARTLLPESPFRFAATAIQNHRLMDFILIQPPGAARPANSDRWLSAAPASRLFQVREGDEADLLRLARIYAGRSVGLVLSGGGARAYAHVGVARALGELRVPIDFVSGASMGAVIAAGIAMGWDMAEIDARIREAFVASSPLSDIAFPLLAMTRGREVERRLERHFGDVQISDLWRPFTCVSTDLTEGGRHTHRRGLLRRALRASLSLPGVLPPVVQDGRVLVDGALTGNLPSELVRDQHDGSTIGVDVGQAMGLRPESLLLRPAGLRWLTSGAWRRGPPIVSVLIRAATVSTAAVEAAALEAVDVAIIPEVDAVELQDWKAYAPAVEAGYRATMAQAETLDRLGR